jgi:glycogen(starch) synthase
VATFLGVRVLMLSWEYPPTVVGGLGRHVDALARELVSAGHDVRVVTRGAARGAQDDLRDGVFVRRSALDPLDIGFTTEALLAWAQAAEHSLIRAALPMLEDWRPDVVHAHDWLVAQSAVTIAQVSGAPIVATVHAMETGRHQGWLPTPLNRGIHSVERWLARESRAVITCSHFMQEEVTRLFELPRESVHVVHNGIDVDVWRTTAASRRRSRARFAGDGPVIAFTGRLVHEKGVQVALAAMPDLTRRHPGLRLVVAGSGPYEPVLRATARRLRLGRSVQWAGFLPDDDLVALVCAADVVVVPSLYEPFGLVALEAAAAGTPLAVADTGGLRDLVEPGVTGARFAGDDPKALAGAVGGLLTDPATARRMARAAVRRVDADFSWPAIAADTAKIYEQVQTSPPEKPFSDVDP